MSRILHHVGRDDFKKTRQRQIGEQKERAVRKLKELQEAEAKRKQIEEAARPHKSNWREETQLQESDWTPVSGSIANSSAQTFHYATPNFETGEPIAVTISGLGGVESVPSTITIDSGFGETQNVSGPNYSQFGLQGYAKPLGNVNRRRDYEDVNPRLDASQEFARAVKSDVFMNARVQNPKTTSVGYFSYMTPAEQLEQARDAKKRFAGGLGNPNFNDHVKGVVGYEKYQQLDDQRKSNEESATRGIWDQWKEATRSGKYELADKLQKQAEQIQSKVYRDFVDKVEVLYFDEFRKQTGLDPFDSPITIEDPPSGEEPDDLPPGPTDAELEKKSKQEAELNAKSDALTKQMEDLYAKLEELPDKGRPIRYEVIEPGDPDYTDTTGMANAIGYNRRPIYSAAANAIQAQIQGLMNQQTAIFAQLNALSGAGPETPAPEQGPDPYSIKDPVVARKDEDNFMDAIADMMGVGTAKDVFDYFSKWNKNKTKDPRPQDLTNLLSPNDKAALQDLVDRSMDGRTDEFGAMGVNNELQNIINGNSGLRNSIGTLDRDAGDGAYVQGDNIVINKAYDFSNAFDILGAGGLVVGLGALGYGIGSRTFSPSDLISGTDTMNMQIKIPIRRKRRMKESTTWNKLKKYR